MDDICDSVHSVQQAKRLRTELDEVLLKGGFQVKGWLSNQGHYLSINPIYKNQQCLLLKLILSLHALTDLFLKRDAKEKAFISRKMNASIRESEKTEIYDEIDWTKLIGEMGYKIRTYPILTCI